MVEILSVCSFVTIPKAVFINAEMKCESIEHGGWL